MEPVEAAKYNYMRLPVREEWGIVMKKDDPLTRRDVLTREDLYDLPLIVGRRGIMRDSVSDVLKLDQTKLNIPITINLPMVSRDLVVNHHYYHLGTRGVYEMYKDDDLAFVPLDKDISQDVNRMFEKLKEAGKNGVFPGLFLYSRMLVL